MRKYIYMMGIIMLSLILVSIKPTYGKVEEETIPVFQEQNSNTFFASLIQEQNTTIKKICTIDYCDTLEGKDLAKAIETYKQKYQAYLTKLVGEEEAFTTILKGFPILKAE